MKQVTINHKKLTQEFVALQTKQFAYSRHKGVGSCSPDSRSRHLFCAGILYNRYEPLPHHKSINTYLYSWLITKIHLHRCKQPCLPKDNNILLIHTLNTHSYTLRTPLIPPTWRGQVWRSIRQQFKSSSRLSIGSSTCQRTASTLPLSSHVQRLPRVEWKAFQCRYFQCMYLYRGGRDRGAICW